MNEILHFTLLGAPTIRLGDQPLTDFATTKAQALLCYLAVTAHAAPHSRDTLATLLWGEMTETQAKQNLRAVLPDLRRLVGGYVRVERQTVTFDRTSPHWIDVAVVRHALTPGRSPVDLATRQAAVDLYQGDFLSGFNVQRAPGFEAWVLEQREQLYMLVVEALFGLVQEYIELAEYARARTANRRLLQIEPWSEPAHRQQMLILSHTGERSAALAQYEACRSILAEEFGVEPLPETTALYEQIRAGTSNYGAGVTSPQPVESPSEAARAGEQRGPAQERGSVGLPTQITGHALPQQITLYGRQAELAILHQWVVEDGCRLVGIFGIGGQGKTALVGTFVRTLAEPAQLLARAINGAVVREAVFSRILWHSLLNAPPLAEVLHAWLSVLDDQDVTTLPTSLDQQLSLLLDYLRRQRCLLVLDNLESILHSDERSGDYRPGYEMYGQLLRRLVDDEHRSCLLLTSRERPQDLASLEGASTIRLVSLAGLSASAGHQMLVARGFASGSTNLGRLVQRYSGNPLGLNLVAETIQSIFRGDIGAFLQAEMLVFDDIRHVLDQQFARLTPLEREVMTWLAIVREPTSFLSIRALLSQAPAPRLLLEAVRSLQRRSLLESHEGSFGLQNVVLEYTTDLLIDAISDELSGYVGSTTLDAREHGRASAISEQVDHSPLPLLNCYALVLAQAKEYVRASQTRLLLQPVAERLVKRRGRTGAVDQIQRLIADLRTAMIAPGFAAANLLHLLLHLEADLRGADFSQLSFRQLYLQGVSLSETSFVGAALIESVFTEPFGLVYTATFSPDGAYLAAGTGEGAIYLWRTADQQLVRVIHAHSQLINKVAFGQRISATGAHEVVLASASDDMSIGFWSLDVDEGEHHAVHLVHEQQKILLAVNLHADGQRLTAIADTGDVLVWDMGVPSDARLSHRFASVPSRLRLIDFSADGQTVAIGSLEGTVQLWQTATGAAGVALTLPTGATQAVALRGDSRMLATGGRQGYLHLWSLPEGGLLQAIETKAGSIDALAFSPDGKLLASTHGDHSIRVWAIDSFERAHLKHTLPGHTHVIWSVLFGPQPAASPEMSPVGDHVEAQQLLVSGSSDQTVRVWDATTGHALYTLRGQPRALGALAIGRAPAAHPGATTDADWLLAAVGYDQMVHLWRGRAAQANGRGRSLARQRGQLYTVALSPDSRTLASGGEDKTICLWDCASGQLLQTFYGHTRGIMRVAFQPGGNLLASGSTDGTVRLWNVPERGVHIHERSRDASRSGQPVAVFAGNPNITFDIAFSPDGRVLASVGRGLVVRLWDMTQPHVPELVEAQKTVQAADEQDIFAVAFSPDGSTLACGGNRLIHLWSAPGHSDDDPTPRILRQHTSWIYSIAFSPDGSTLVSGSSDSTVCLWDVASGTLRAVLRGHIETIYSVAFSPDGDTVVSCGPDGMINLWNSQTGECVNTLRVEGPYAGMNIRGATGITQAQKVALKALGAVEV